MSWLTFKLFVEKSFLWLKTYWYFPVVVIYTLVLWLVFRKDGSAAIGALEIRSDSYKKQIDVINKSHIAEIKKKEELNKVFNETIEKVEVELKKKSEVLDKNKKNRVKEIVENHSSDPKKLAELVKESFGFEIVE
jgi:type II secretory pathway component PulL